MYVVRGKLPAEVGALLMRAVEAARRRGADALTLIAERSMAAGFDERSPVSGARAERYQVVLHVSAETLLEDGKPARSAIVR